MIGTEFAAVLLTVVLILVAIACIGVIALIALGIKTVLEVFALARTVRAEVTTISDVVKAAGERLTGVGSGALGFLSLFKKKAARKKTR